MSLSNLSRGFSLSPWSNMKESKKEDKYYGQIIDDEIEAESVWKSILKRKGLPLDTKYKYEDTFNKAYDESYCDMLYLTIEKKKENPEAAKSWGRSTFEWLPPPAPPTRILSSDYVFYFDEYFDDRKRGKKITRNVNGILYPKGSEASKKRFNLTVEMGKKKAENFKELQAKGLALPGLCYRPVTEEDSQYWL